MEFFFGGGELWTESRCVYAHVKKNDDSRISQFDDRGSETPAGREERR